LRPEIQAGTLRLENRTMLETLVKEIAEQWRERLKLKVILRQLAKRYG
jgi:hypothetical protein